MKQSLCGTCGVSADIVTTAVDAFVVWMNSSIDLAAGRVGLTEARAAQQVCVCVCVCVCVSGCICFGIGACTIFVLSRCV